MAYFTPYIDSLGMHIPSYNDIRDSMIDEMKSIFGNDIYIDEDSQDYQQISIFAKKVFDTFNLAELAYNNRTPITAIGTALDNLVAFANITRKSSTHSIAQLTISGTQNTVIANGVAIDISGHKWDLPDSVTIPSSGIINVEATCQEAGNITALAGEINSIYTPTFGWDSVTNVYAANPGSEVETDAELRGRYSKAVLSPSRTVLDGIVSAIEEVTNVTRVKGYENDTGSVDANGFPAHSITMVVEGGDQYAIGEAIYYKKTPGCYTNGTTSVVITDYAGTANTIRFYRPTEVPIYVKVSLTRLQTYNSGYEDKIKEALVQYISSMQISDDVLRSVLWSNCVSVMDDIKAPAFNVTNVQLSTNGSTWTTNDIAIAATSVATLSADNIQVVTA